MEGGEGLGGDVGVGVAGIDLLDEGEGSSGMIEAVEVEGAVDGEGEEHVVGD